MDAIRCWIDALYSMHADLKVHSGFMMFLGNSAAASKSRKHRINLRSSTESEIIGVNNHMPGVLWTLLFLGGPGFQGKEEYHVPRLPECYPHGN